MRSAISLPTFISPEIAQVLKSSPATAPLSPRQADVLELVTLGLSNEDIAYKLGITAPVVRDYLKTIFAKLGAANRAEAVAIALRKHLLKI